MASNRSSEVWKYFDEAERGKAMCKFCRKKLACAGASTSGLRRHLETIHKLKFVGSRTETVPVPVAAEMPNRPESAVHTAATQLSTTMQQTSILDFVDNESREEHVARLIALDGMNARTVTRSRFIRQSFVARKMKLPKCEKAVMQLLHDFYQQVKSKTIEELNAMKAEGCKFGSTLDEWTSIRNRRYLNVNLHSLNGRCFNLGLIRIPGSCPAEEVERLFWIKLQEFGMNKEDVIGCTSDGARVMIKFARMLDAIHQLCFNHGIHLGVIDVIVEKKSDTAAIIADADQIDDNAESDSGDESVSSDSEDGDDEDDYNADAAEIIIRPHIHRALAKVRKIVRLFRKSPVKNAILQKYITQERNKELNLILDCKTRWNSTENMLQRFLDIYEPCKAALSALNQTNILLSSDELSLLGDLLHCLQPIKIAVLELSKRDCDLLKSEGKARINITFLISIINSSLRLSLYFFLHTAVLKFLLSALQKQASHIVEEFYQALKKRIAERRNKQIVSLIKYLHNKDLDSTEEMPLTSKKTCANLACNLFFAFFKIDEGEEASGSCESVAVAAESAEAEDDVDSNSMLGADLDYAKMLAAAIEKETGAAKPSTFDSDRFSFSQMKKILQHEIAGYEKSNILGPNLQKILSALKCIQPTSTESERTFSLAENVCTKKRARLSDQSINNIVFLKFYFMKKDANQTN